MRNEPSAETIHTEQGAAGPGTGPFARRGESRRTPEATFGSRFGEAKHSARLDLISPGVRQGKQDGCPEGLWRPSQGALLHVNHRERLPVNQRNGDWLDRHVAPRPEEFGPCQSGAHLITGEACGARCLFASLKDHAPHALPGPGRMDEESTNLGGIAPRVEQNILTAGPAVAAIERFAFAPAAAANNHPLRLRVRSPPTSLLIKGRFCNDVRAISNELAVHPKNRFQCAFDLRRIVVLSLQATRGSFDQFAQNRHVLRHREPQASSTCRCHFASPGHAANSTAPRAPGGFDSSAQRIQLWYDLPQTPWHAGP